MAIAQHEAIAIPPSWLRGAVLAPGPAGGGRRPEEVRQRRTPHRRARVARSGTLDHVGGQGAHGIHTFQLERRATVGGKLGQLVVRV